MYIYVPKTSTRAMAMCLLGTHLCTSALGVSPWILVRICVHSLHMCTCIHTSECISVHLDRRKRVRVFCAAACALVPPLSDPLRLLLDSEEMSGFCLSLPVEGTFPSQIPHFHSLPSPPCPEP